MSHHFPSFPLQESHQTDYSMSLSNISSRKMIKNDASKFRRHLKDGEKKLHSEIMADDKKTQTRIDKQFERQNVPKRKAAYRTIELFSHLNQPDLSQLITTDSRLLFSSRGIHPSILKLGAQLSKGDISGSSCCTVALIAAFIFTMNDFKAPEKKDLMRECVKFIEPYINFLKECRPLSLSMRNTITFMKYLLKGIPEDLCESDVKQCFTQQNTKFIHDRVILTSKIISDLVISLIRNGDVILVFVPCGLVMNILLCANARGIKFRVVIIDSRPYFRGINCARILSTQGISCSYQLLSAITFVIKECTLVLVSVEGIFSNGSVLGKVGTSMLCLVAKTYNVPIMVCCETFKFTERVQIDAFVYNELSDSEDVSCLPDGISGPLEKWKEINTLRILNLKYDITPPELIDVVVTESGLIPCTSIPVIIRVHQI